jgi:hypothetical protein
MVTVTFQTTAPSAAPPGHFGAGPRFLARPLAVLAWCFVLVALLGVLLARRVSRRWRYVLSVLLLLAMAGLAGACGGGGDGSSFHNPGTTPGTYPITVSATSGGVTHMVTYTLTVQ